MRIERIIDEDAERRSEGIAHEALVRKALNVVAEAFHLILGVTNMLSVRRELTSRDIVRARVILRHDKLQIRAPSAY